jgi:hypothetical protein
MNATTDILTAAADHLRSLGLCLVGQSAKSRSTYWGVDSVSQKALRLSDHDVAYESSDCPVCVGVEGCQDCDVILAGDDWQDKLTAAAKRAIEATELDADTLEEIAYADDLTVDEVRADKLAWLAKHFPKLF